MALLDDVLAANAAAAERGDVPVPAVGADRRAVILTCSEIHAPKGRDLAHAFGLSVEEALVVANAGTRVLSPSGETAAAVVAALAERGGGEVFVVAHENCAFLDADPESVVGLVRGGGSSALTAAEALIGESHVSARARAIASAATLRTSPFIGGAIPVHALLWSDGRGRLSVEERGYDVAARADAPSAVPSFGAAPSPILSAPGGAAGFTRGPVTLFGSGPSSLLAAPPPELGAPGAAFAVTAPPPIAPPSAQSFVMPSAPMPPMSVAPAVPPAPPPPKLDDAPPPIPPSLAFDDIVTRVPEPDPPRPQGLRTGPPKPPDTDDPFRRAAETLERLRRQRRR